VRLPTDGLTTVPPVITSSLTTDLLATAAGLQTGHDTGGSAPRWIVIPIMVIALGVMVVRALRRRR
jgi:hypothetical protein